MSRYFYLLCLLIAINGTFCYDYNKNGNLKNNHGRRLRQKDRSQKLRLVNKEDHQRKPQNYELVEDKEPIAQIDVASFIQRPDEYAVEDSFPYELDNQRRKTNFKHENDYGSLLKYNSDEYIMKRSNKRPYYLNPSSDNSFDLGPNPHLLKGINLRHLNLDSPPLHGSNNEKVPQNSDGKQFTNSYNPGLYESVNMNHKPEKKCVLKYMKFPFFFHNRTETSKPKKEKKRKIFCFNCSKKQDKSNDTSNNNQFKETSKKESLETTNKVSFNIPSGNFGNGITKGLRDKRDEWTNIQDRQRQLKELEEIQRKVDSVEISPAYQKTS